MRIGLDFDNTLACYDKVFQFIARDMRLVPDNWSGGKAEIRGVMRARSQGELHWQRLQGQAYGKHMNLAALFPGVANFLLRLKARKDEVFIISHKTEFGHQDPEKVPLRREALQWMRAHRFFDSAGFGLSEQNVFFESTREGKVRKIAELKCDLFVDDLWEVFAEAEFPKNVKKILFGADFEDQKSEVFGLASRSWRDIARHVLGSESDEEIEAQIEFAIGDLVESFRAVKGRANSRVFMAQTRKDIFATKFYPDVVRDPRDRLGVEKSACEFLSAQGSKSTLEVVSTAPDLNIGVYRWIEGVKVSMVSDVDVEQALEFIEHLHQTCDTPSAARLPDASEACLREEDLWNQISYKRSDLNKVVDRSIDLKKFLLEEFDPLLDELSRLTVKLFPKRDRFAKLPVRDQILSPSDFGFHNAIRKADGSLVWIDFEYFGWDDPVKLMADFIWHPGFSLSERQNLRWKARCLEMFSKDSDLPERFQQRFPLYGLRWCLILLNIFFRPESERESRSQVQLDTARNYLGRIEGALISVDIPT